VANGPNIFQMLLVLSFERCAMRRNVFCVLVDKRRSIKEVKMPTTAVRMLFTVAVLTATVAVAQESKYDMLLLLLLLLGRIACTAYINGVSMC